MLALQDHPAALVVVGRRGRGLIRLRIGSTTTAVLRQAACPVAVVPPDVAPPTDAAVVVGSRVDGVLVENVATTSKTFPGFADAWAGLFGG